MDIKKLKILFILSLVISILIAVAAFIAGKQLSRSYYWLGLWAFPFFLLTYHWHLRLKEAGLRLHLKNTWGSPDDRQRDFEEIPFYFRMIPNNRSGETVLDDRTWSDLDMDLVFSRVDRTLSVPGEQILYSFLRRPLLNFQGLEERHRWIDLFLRDSALRENCRSILAKIGRKEGGALPELLWNDPTGKIPKAFLLILLPILLTGFGILLLFSHSWAWYGLAAVLLVNMIIHYRAKRTIGEYVASIRYLGRMISWARKLAGFEYAGLDESMNVLRSELKSVSKIARKGVYLVAPEWNNFLYDYVNIVYLIEVKAFSRIRKMIEVHRHELQHIFERLGFIDAMLSIASYRVGIRGYCEPRFTDAGPRLEFQSAGHPLVENSIPNSLSMNSSGALITGSNMSGKTTFLKTIGVNAVLAQTIFTCMAKTYQTCFFRVATLIGRKDNLIEGKSYYLDEIQALLRLLAPKTDSVADLCLLDELFRGTNSVERIAASVEVLLYLGKRNGCTLASTHDLEITDLVGSGFMNFHFQEKIEEEGIAFNYKLMDGPSTTRNAIKLLSSVGYPSEIVEAAERRVRSLNPTD
ncbi:MAG: hypothetical protein L6425_03305 [Candidatus Aminicenantes bacterium]|nr:hypothetical protein [Candidatus Aminicenantes bacterium]